MREWRGCWVSVVRRLRTPHGCRDGHGLCAVQGRDRVAEVLASDYEIDVMGVRRSRPKPVLKPFYDPKSERVKRTESVRVFAARCVRRSRRDAAPNPGVFWKNARQKKPAQSDGCAGFLLVFWAEGVQPLKDVDGIGQLIVVFAQVCSCCLGAFAVFFDLFEFHLRSGCRYPVSRAKRCFGIEADVCVFFRFVIIWSQGGAVRR